MVGALTALEDHLGVDVRSFDEMVGTSAGSVLSSLLASGVSVAELRTHQMEGSLTYGKLAGFEWNYDESTGGDRPPPPRAGFGSTVLLRKPIRELRQLPPMAVLAALLPEGRGRLDSVGALVRHVVGDGWVERPGSPSRRSTTTSGCAFRSDVTVRRRRGQPRRSWPRVPSPVGTSR